MTDDLNANSPRRSGPPALAIAALLGALVSGGLVWALVGGATDAPAAEEEHGEELPPGVVEIPEAAQQNAGVKMVEVRQTALPVHLEVTGAVAPEGSRVAEVRPLARGLITQVSVRLGDRVRAGQTLLTYDNIQLGERLGEYSRRGQGFGRRKATWP